MRQRWVLDYESATTVITGATRRKLVREDARASALTPLPLILRLRLPRVRRSVRPPLARDSD